MRAPLTKARKPSHAASLASLEGAVAAGRPALSRAVDAHLGSLAVRLGPVSQDGRLIGGVEDRARQEHEAFFATAARPILLSAAEDGEEHAGVAPEAALVSAGEVAARQDEWAVLMAEGQQAAWEAAEFEVGRIGATGADADALIGLVTGQSPTDAVRLVRSAATVRKALRRHRGGLSKAVPASALKNAAALIKARALKTAGYELARAYNSAERAKFGQALQLGLAGEVRRTWVTSREASVCKVCAPLHGKTLVSRTRSSLYNAFDRARNLRYPPAHIACMCVVAYEVLG